MQDGDDDDDGKEDDDDDDAISFVMVDALKN